ncbi:MAG: hypothetical protein GY953_53095 [bacterium]|nr:hypothetical protein [bacterium]
MASAGAVVAAVQNRYIRAFQDAGATSEATAKSLDELGCRDSLILRRLVSMRVLVEAGGQRYYLNEEALSVFLRRRRALALGVLAILLTIVLVIVWGRFG